MLPATQRRKNSHSENTRFKNSHPQHAEMTVYILQLMQKGNQYE